VHVINITVLQELPHIQEGVFRVLVCLGNGSLASENFYLVTYVCVCVSVWGRVNGGLGETGGEKSEEI